MKRLSEEEAFDRVLKAQGAELDSFFAARLRTSPARFFEAFSGGGLTHTAYQAACVYFVVQSGMVVMVPEDRAVER